MKWLQLVMGMKIAQKNEHIGNVTRHVARQQAGNVELSDNKVVVVEVSMRISRLSAACCA
jgi:hypothetical protein